MRGRNTKAVLPGVEEGEMMGCASSLPSPLWGTQKWVPVVVTSTTAFKEEKKVELKYRHRAK